MTNTAENNKRIAKNTLLLYFRMLFMMVVSLYTSRVVLDTLGVEDYGIYNVVGGIVGMFSFINGAMSTGTQRYLNFALGIGDPVQLRRIFNTCLNIHFILAIIIIFLAETIGLWFLCNQMNIPEERMNAAFWVYQFSIFTAAIMIISVPYNAVIIAHERMNIFAYISIVEVILKLLIVYLLLIGKTDRLILYAFLMLGIQIGIRILYGIYCKRHFPETEFKFVKDSGLIKEILGFTGWNLWGSCAYIAFTQGINILLNIFFGPTVNAARGVAAQVQNAVLQFSVNFQTALNPQIIKSYAQKDLAYMHKLVYSSSKFTFFLLLLLTLPILLETETILSIWLKQVPEYAVPFLRLILCISIVDAISNPLMVSATATGQVKLYQSVCGGILLAIVPIAYIVLKLGAPPTSVFIVHLIIGIITLIARLIIIQKLIHLSMNSYIKIVISRIILVGATSVIFPIIIKILLTESLFSFIIICCTSLVSTSLCIFFIGLKTNEQRFILNKISTIATKFKHQ